MFEASSFALSPFKGRREAVGSAGKDLEANGPWVGVLRAREYPRGRHVEVVRFVK